jgi:bifunctional non-homologous end joining protein LigD
LERRVLPKLTEPVQYLAEPDVSLRDLVASVKAQGLEGLVAKRRDSHYEPGLRSGAWQKMRVKQGHEFVIGGYTVGGKTFDALVFGYYEGDRLNYGLTPVVRAQLMKKFRGLETKECPFANLPEKKSGRWGAGLTAAKMKDCRWLQPALVGQFEFLEFGTARDIASPCAGPTARRNPWTTRHAMTCSPSSPMQRGERPKRYSSSKGMPLGSSR